ncbi:MAG TPA: hypothetical protein VMQ17_07730 [Candidatus Sulfotelmatobacter sp.]|nr:hypothetical protein [Candidatus Sulfotelmatobacter sp.]
MFRSQGQNPHFGKTPKQESALYAGLLPVVHRNYEDIRPNLFDCFHKVTAVSDLADQFNVGLITDQGHKKFPHQTGLIRK